MTIQNITRYVKGHGEISKGQSYRKETQEIDLIHVFRVQEQKVDTVNPAYTAIDRCNQQNPNKKKGDILLDMMKYQLNRQGI